MEEKKFCTQCSKPLETGARYCGYCAAPAATPRPALESVPSVPRASIPPTVMPRPTPPAAPQAQAAPQAETVRCILHNIKKPKSFGRWDIYNVAFTRERCIFALLTSDMLKQAAKEANEQGKAEGKGFLSRWDDQIAITLAYADKYQNMAPDQILAETAGNFSIANTDIKKVKFRQTHSAQDRGAMVRRVMGEVTFESTRGKQSYNIDFYPTNEIATIKQALGNKVEG